MHHASPYKVFFYNLPSCLDKASQLLWCIQFVSLCKEHYLSTRIPISIHNEAPNLSIGSANPKCPKVIFPKCHDIYLNYALPMVQASLLLHALPMGQGNIPSHTFPMSQFNLAICDNHSGQCNGGARHHSKQGSYTKHLELFIYENVILTVWFSY
jgi:hypothetical protein